MKSESNVRPLLPDLPAADAFRAFFDMVDAPAAVCDLSLSILKANAPFEVLCGKNTLEGKALSEALGHVIPMPDEGRTVDVEIHLSSGQSVTISASRRGQTVAVVARRFTLNAESLAATGRALIEQARIESQLLEIGRAVAGATSEEELVATVAKGVKGLFPGRQFCVRIVDPRTCLLTSLYAEGRMRDGARDRFVLRRSMVDKTHLETRGLPADRVVILTQELPLLFHDSVRGIAAPLVTTGQLFGAINIEYPAGLTADAVADEKLLIQLANQIAVAVRNAKLIDELTFVRKYLEELLENANALILVVNRESKIVVFNRALVQLTGWSKSEMLGGDVLRLVSEQGRLEVMRALASGMKGEAGRQFETALKSPTGNEIKVTLASSTVLSASGEIEGVIAIGQDLTKMKDLEKRVIHAEKLASLGQLAASVVHEINNPMTAVSTYAEALLKRALAAPNTDESDLTKFRKIVDNSDRVLRFTHDLVTYARPAQDKAEEIDINATIERAVGFCEHVVSKHDLKLERKLVEMQPFLAVKQNLIQVFVNLITNACHATAKGGVISISSSRENDVAVIRVSDTGTGMPSDVQQHIFEPFFTTKPAGKGTGLGLSIVQGVIESHGGTIAVESTVGIGTTFVIRLPMLYPAKP